MSKELTPLEAFENVKRTINTIVGELRQVKCYKEFDLPLSNNRDLDIIETALKRIPELEKEIEDTHKAYSMAIEEHIKDENDYIKWIHEGGYGKKIKALEIIKNKCLNTNEFWYMKNNYLWDTYVESMRELYWGDEDLDKILKTKEEYELLKEVLHELS